MQILVTGGSGYIGNYVIEQLLADGHFVTSVDLQSPFACKNSYVNSKNFRFVQGDVVIPGELDVDFHTFDVVLPLAAIVGRQQCELHPIKANEVNSIAIKNLVKLLNPNQLIIFPQTNMGLVQENAIEATQFQDNSILKPISWYVETKLRGENEVMKHEKSISLRLSSVYGVSHPMKDHLLLNFMVKEAVQKHTISLYEPNFYRSFVSLNNLSKLINWIIENHPQNIYGQKINVSDPSLNITKLELAKQIQLATDCEIVITEGFDPDLRNYIVKSKLLAQLNFEFENIFLKELETLANHYGGKHVCKANEI
jgi:nucleoside-diphosphate-sugar epimerase